MRKSLLIIGTVGLTLTSSLSALAQSAEQAAPNAATAAAGNAPVIVRDPRTGQLFQQELQTVDQPVTTWQRKFVQRTVVTPQTVYENQQVPQTTYVAKTEYVLQPKVKGWWNPFAQPTYAYEYVPVTRWVPQTQMITRQVPSVKMVPSTEQVPIDEPVQTTQKVTQVVLKPLPASPTALAYSPPPAVIAPAYRPVVANNSQPLVASVPVLSQQRPLSSFQPGTLLSAPVSGLRSIVRSAAAPFQTQATYYAPTNVATLPSTSARDANQAGMRATVLR